MAVDPTANYEDEDADAQDEEGDGELEIHVVGHGRYLRPRAWPEASVWGDPNFWCGRGADKIVCATRKAQTRFISLREMENRSLRYQAKTQTRLSALLEAAAATAAEAAAGKAATTTAASAEA